MGDLKTRFGIMMFLQYAIWGSWTTALGAHLDKLGFSGSEIMLIGVPYLIIFAATAVGGLRYANLKELSLKDWLVYFFQQQILPWVMSYSLFRGWLDFRHETKFSSF